MKGHFAGSNNQECELECEDPLTFRYINRLLYCGELATDRMDKKLGPDKTQARLCLIWTCADGLIMPELQNVVVSNLLSKGKVPKLRGHWRQIWEETSSDSELRYAITSLYRKSVADDDGVNEIYKQDPPTDLLYDILNDMYERHKDGKANMWLIEDTCDFHVHHKQETASDVDESFEQVVKKKKSLRKVPW